MSHIYLEASSLEELNNKLRQQQAGNSLYSCIHCETHGFQITGWILKASSEPSCKVNGLKPLVIQINQSTTTNIRSYYLSPVFPDKVIENIQYLEIYPEIHKKVEGIQIKAVDRTSPIHLLQLVRSDLQLQSTKNIHSWAITSGFKEMNLLRQDAVIINSLNQLDEDTGRNNFWSRIWDKRKDLQTAFLSISSPLFSEWIRHHGIKEYELLTAAESCLPIHFPQALTYNQRDFGVNLIGYASSILGIGEDLRTCQKAFELVGIPTAIIDIPTQKASKHLRQQAIENPDQLAPYAINLVCMTAEEHARVFLELGYSIFSERYNIGYWPWELANWPDPWKPIFGLADEVWASSRFTYNALNKNLKHTKNTKLMYMPLSVGSIKPLSSQERMNTRKTFDLSQESFLVICSFDGRSSFFRKNPWGAIKAFQQAFPTELNTSTELIIKTINAGVDEYEWSKLKAVTEADSRIKLINKSLNREGIINLYGCCDTLISLHRAEGFGRILAESLLLGLNVVATNYSGNTDFCSGANAYPIDYDLTLITEGEYVHSRNQYWAEPRVDHAASILYNLYADHKASIKSIYNYNKRGPSQTNHNKLSAHIAGLNYKNRLIQIWNEPNHDRQKKLRWDYASCLYEIKD